MNTTHLSVTGHLQPSVSIGDRVILDLVNYDHNQDKLRTAPFFRLEDMAVVFACLTEGPLSIIDVSSKECRRVLVNNDDLQQWQVDKEQLYEAALRNMAAMMPAKISSVASVLGLSGRQTQESEIPELYMISNEQGHNGAAVILYPGMLEQIAERFGSSYFLIPSSIHELLILPGWKEDEGENLSRTVRDINNEEVAPEEILSYNVYYYDKNRRQLDVLGRESVHAIRTELPAADMAGNG